MLNGKLGARARVPALPWKRARTGAAFCSRASQRDPPAATSVLRHPRQHLLPRHAAATRAVTSRRAAPRQAPLDTRAVSAVSFALPTLPTAARMVCAHRPPTRLPHADPPEQAACRKPQGAAAPQRMHTDAHGGSCRVCRRLSLKCSSVFNLAPPPTSRREPHRSSRLEVAAAQERLPPLSGRGGLGLSTWSCRSRGTVPSTFRLRRRSCPCAFRSRAPGPCRACQPGSKLSSRWRRQERRRTLRGASQESR